MWRRSTSIPIAPCTVIDEGLLRRLTQPLPDHPRPVRARRLVVVAVVRRSSCDFDVSARDRHDRRLPFSATFVNAQRPFVFAAVDSPRYFRSVARVAAHQTGFARSDAGFRYDRLRHPDRRRGLPLPSLHATRDDESPHSTSAPSPFQAVSPESPGGGTPPKQPARRQRSDRFPVVFSKFTPVRRSNAAFRKSDGDSEDHIVISQNHTVIFENHGCDNRNQCRIERRLGGAGESVTALLNAEPQRLDTRTQ